MPNLGNGGFRDGRGLPHADHRPRLEPRREYRSPPLGKMRRRKIEQHFRILRCQVHTPVALDPSKLPVPKSPVYRHSLVEKLYVRALGRRDRALGRRDRALRRRDRALRSVLFVLRRRDRALRSVLFVLRRRDRALRSMLFALRRRDRALRSMLFALGSPF